MYSLDIVGYLASGLVFATFYMTEMLPLRLAAIASNLAFIAYGYLGEMTPILLLHVWLLPLNVWRLRQTWAVQRQAGGGCGQQLRHR
jgi:ABC-type glycerol-3-phosphate transport system permease component